MANLVTLIVGIGGLALSLLGLVFVAIQIRLLRIQIVNAQQAFTVEQERSKKQSSLEFIASTMERRADLQNSVPTAGEPKRVAQFLDSLKDDSNAASSRRDLNRFLSYYEAAAVGVNAGVFDLTIIDRAWGAAIVRTFAAYRTYIYERRDLRRQPSLFCELEQLAEAIAKRHNKEISDYYPSAPAQRDERRLAASIAPVGSPREGPGPRHLP